MGSKRRLNTEILIEKLKKIHGDKYSYNEVEYKGVNNKIILTCHKHGNFHISPFTALSGSGCPKCKGRG